MTGDGTDAASESNGNLFTLPSREEENDKVVNRGKPWSIEMLVSLVALCDYRPKHKQDEGGGRRLALAITVDPLAVGRGRVPLLYIQRSPAHCTRLISLR